MREKGLSALASAAIGGSFVFAFLGLLIITGAASGAAGSKDIIASLLFWKGTALFAAYGLSLYAVASVPGKSRTRKIISWGFSAALHILVIAYVAVVWNWGLVAAIPLIPEIVVVLLCVAGLIAAMRERSMAYHSFRHSE